MRLGELDSRLPSPDLEKPPSDFLHYGPAFFGTNTRLNRATEASPWALEIARRALGEWSDEPDREDVAQGTTERQLWESASRYRKWLRSEPQDAVAWVDVSRIYANLGLDEKAAKCMTIALQLAGESRFVLRSATRLWIHLDDPERAHEVLARRSITPHDPWLLAAEIAACDAARRPQRLVRIARGVLSDEFSVPPRQLSELASAVATLELDAGSLRKSRKLFRQSLANPTENSIAQAAWASRRDPGMGFDNRYLDHANAFEARSWRFFGASDWGKVIRECENWRRDQPFSSRPAVQGSYVAAVVLREFGESERFAEAGLRANPSNFVLLNNLAFACACAGRTEKAGQTLAKIGTGSLGREARAVFLATSGLLAFRTSRVEDGRRLYAESLDLARKVEAEDQVPGLYALAVTFYAMEEAAVSPTEGVELLARARRALERFQDPVMEVLKGRIDDGLEAQRGGSAVRE